MKKIKYLFLLFLILTFSSSTFFAQEKAEILQLLQGSNKTDYSSLKTKSESIENIESKKKDQLKQQLLTNQPKTKERPYQPSLIEQMFISQQEEAEAYSALLQQLDKNGQPTGNIPEETPTMTVFSEEKGAFVTLDTEKLTKKSKDIIKQFGYDLFQNAFTTSAFTFDIPVGPDYILGPGDTLIIRIWGKMDENIEASIDRRGQIYIPRIGHISLAGEKFGRAKRIIEKTLSKHYVNFELSVTISNLHSIKVFILGDVNRPGAYDVSSLSTAFMALYLAGGPTKIGSLRNIRLKRNKKNIKKIDLYRYLLYGDRSQDPKLKAFDTIFVPPIGRVIKIAGKVKRPGIFEIQKGTSLWAAITKLAGGFSSHSYKNRIQIERTDKNGQLEIKDYNYPTYTELKEKLSKTLIKEGDNITVYKGLDIKNNYVTASGNIKRPGKFAFKKGMTVNSLIVLAEGLKEDTYTKRIEIFRYISDNKRKILTIDFSKNKNFKLKEWDIVKVYSNQDIIGKQYITIEGAVRIAGKYKLMENMHISDSIFLAGLLPEATSKFCELFRKTKGGKDKIIRFNLKQIIDNPKDDNNIELIHNDRLFIRYDPELVKSKRIEIKGEVKHPGIYYAQEQETLYDILKRAGGFTNKAFLPGIIFRRKTAKQRQIAGQMKILEEERKRMIYDKEALGTSEEASTNYEQILRFLERKIKESIGRIIISISSLDALRESKKNIQLEDNDILEIPKTPSSVQIVGGVQNPTSILYEEHKDVAYYISQVGGFSRFADKNNIYVIKANGTIQKNTNTISVGDTVYVPELMILPIDWLDIVTKTSTILFNIATSITVINSLR